MQKIKNFVKKETVLVVAVVLAVISMFIVPPDKEYLGYIDFHTIGVLFCLMAVMAGLKEVGVFRYIAEKLLLKVRKGWQLVLILVMLCFFLSMFITNDVALITFVPFAFIVLRLLGEQKEKALIIPVVVLQTIAANLGSMLTPIGNPHNLYLYGKSGLDAGEFVKMMLPYTALSFVLLVGYCLYLGKKSEEKQLTVTFQELTSLQGKGFAIGRYLLLFGLSLLTVAQKIPFEITVIVVLIVYVLFDRKLLGKIDYALLLTFAGFFVFIGNMGRVPAFCNLLQTVLSNNQVVTAVISSQIISNVPTAILLSGFTTDYHALVLGTNIGGLGTLIASMASLISYKYIVKENRCGKAAYFGYFTITNVIFLAALMLLWWCIG